MPEGSFLSFTASHQYLAESLPSSCHERPRSSSAPSRSREIRRRLTAEGSCETRSVRENCHHRPSMRATLPSFSIAFRIFWLTTLISEGVVSSYRTHVRPRRSLGSFAPLAGRMKVRRIPRAAPKRPASKTTLSRGEAWPDSEGSDAGGLLIVQSSRANTNAAKSTSRASSRSRPSVVVPELKEVVQGSTCATSSRPRVSACSSFCCFPDEPRKIRGLSIHFLRQQVGRRPFRLPLCPNDDGTRRASAGNNPRLQPYLKGYSRRVKRRARQEQSCRAQEKFRQQQPEQTIAAWKPQPPSWLRFPAHLS